MNKSEENAYNWLIEQGYKNIIFHPTSTPDFTTDDDGFFEVKRPNGNNGITFINNQFDTLINIKNSKILIFDESSKVPLSIINMHDLIDKPSTWDNYHISYAENDMICLLSLIDEYAETLHYHLNLKERELITKLYRSLALRADRDNYLKNVCQSLVDIGDSIITTDGRIFTKHQNEAPLIYQIFALRYPELVLNHKYKGEYINLGNTCKEDLPTGFTVEPINRQGELYNQPKM